MKKTGALSAALTLVLALAAPVAAAKPIVEFDDLPLLETFDIPAGELCDFPVTYRSQGTESLMFWDPKGDEPEAEAWVKGLYQRGGIDAFQANGNKVSGKFRFNSHLSDLVLGDAAAWEETTSGKYWGINIPGQGRVFHEAGNFRQVVDAISDDMDTWIYTQLREPRGSAIFDEVSLCEALAA